MGLSVQCFVVLTPRACVGACTNLIYVYVEARQGVDGTDGCVCGWVCMHKHEVSTCKVVGTYRMEVRALSVQMMPALAMDTVCCSIACLALWFVGVAIIWRRSKSVGRSVWGAETANRPKN